MPAVQKIACVNNAGFVMSFFVELSGLRTDATGNYPINQTRVIDLGKLPIPEGAVIWPVVDAILGKTKSGDPHVTFAKNDETATYDVKGTTLNFSVRLIGADGETEDEQEEEQAVTA